VHRTFSKPHLICRSRVKLSHLQGRPPKNCEELMCRCAVVCCNYCACLAQTVRCAVLKASLIAPLAKLVAKTGIGERSSQIVHKERHVATWRCINDLLQGRQDRQGQPLARLALCDYQLATAYMLTAKTDRVSAPLSGKEQQGKCQSRFAAHRMLRFELADFFNCPGVKTG
jgi:hypothetical protein